VNPRLMRAPRKLYLEITANCNLRCRYCYFFNNSAVEYHDLSTAAWLQFFNELGSIGVMEVLLAGGEPFYRPDLHELLDGIVNNRMRFALLSNGGLIDDDMAGYLARSKRCSYVQISLDGSRPEIHDAARGKGSWEAAVDGIRTLQRNKVKTTVRLTIHHYNVDDLENSAWFLLDELGLEHFSTNSAGYLGNCRQHSEEMLLTIEERQRAMETLLRLKKIYGARINGLAGPLAEGLMWRRMSDARAGGEPGFSNAGRLTACGCVFSNLTVRPDGSIIPCSLLPHLVLGSINRDPIMEIWQNAPVLQELRARQDIPLSTFEFCSHCEYQPFCTGNCPGPAYSLTGRVNHPNPDACLRQFLREGGRLC
jgi:SynChlorMet cassette radical SAM/SPASM protein ScmE